MLAIQTMIIGLSILMLIAFYLFQKGYQKQGLVLRNITFNTSVFYTVLVLVIGLW